MTACAGGPPARPVRPFAASVEPYEIVEGIEYCARSSSGQDVVCGSAATYCERSRDGKTTACSSYTTSAYLTPMDAGAVRH